MGYTEVIHRGFRRLTEIIEYFLNIFLLGFLIQFFLLLVRPGLKLSPLPVRAACLVLVTEEQWLPRVAILSKNTI